MPYNASAMSRADNCTALAFFPCMLQYHHIEFTFAQVNIRMQKAERGRNEIMQKIRDGLNRVSQNQVQPRECYVAVAVHQIYSSVFFFFLLHAKQQLHAKHA
jgi:hypothetical protein